MNAVVKQQVRDDEDAAVAELEESGEAAAIQPMTEDELVNYCTDEISRGIGGSVASDNDADISVPLDYYFGRRPALQGSKAKDPNASRFVSMDVMNGVEATVAEIMPTFTTEMIAFYEPEDERDEDQARMESELVNYLFMEEYNGYELLQKALKDAFLHRNCTAKAFWDERAYVEYETFENVPEMALQMVLQPESEMQSVEVVEQEMTEEGNTEAADAINAAQILDPDAADMAMQDPESLQDIQAAILAAQDKYTVKIKRTTVIGKPVITSVAPEHVVVSGDHDTPVLHDVRFVAHEDIVTASSLIEQGFDPAIVDTLSEYNQSIEESSRTRSQEEIDYSTGHKSTRMIRVHECYPLIDFDGDGIAERRKVVISDKTLLSNDEWKAVPLVGGTAIIVPHKYKGVSLYDRLKQIQESKTPIARSIIDGTQLSTNPRIGVVTGEVNLDDLLTSRTGGVVRMENPNSVIEMPNPQVPDSSYTMLQYMDSQRSERGGGAIDITNKMQNFTGDGQDIQGRIMTAMELNNALMGRTIGETLVRGIFVQLHNILREHHTGEISARVGGKWLTTVPSEWKTRTSVTIQIGSSYAERARQSGVLREVIAYQAQLKAEGSVMYNEDKHYSAITDSVNMSGVKNPDRYFVDPRSPEGQKANEQITQKQKAAQEKEDMMKAAMVKAQTDMASAETLKGRADMLAQSVKLQLENYKTKSTNEINFLKLQLNTSQQQTQDLKDGLAQQFDYDELAATVALKLTEMEAEAGKDLSPDYEANQ